MHHGARRLKYPPVMGTNMVEVDDTLMAEHLIAEALEAGDFDVPGHISLGEHGQYDKPIDWDLNDLDPEECDVDMYDDMVVVAGTIDVTYTVKTASATRMQPAEYRTETAEVYVVIERDLGDMSQPRVVGEFV